MSNTPYLILCSGAFAVSLVILACYFALSERKDFLEISDTIKTTSMKKAGMIQAVLFILSSLVLYSLSPDKTWFQENNFLYLCALIAGFGLIGLTPSEKKASKLATAFFQLAGISCAVFLFPENTVFLKTELPLLTDNILTILLWFICFRLMFRLDSLPGFSLEQVFCVGLTCFLALFLSSATLPVSFFQFSGLLCPAAIAIGPFYLLGYRLPMKGVATNIFCFMLSWVSFYLITQDVWGAGVLLMAYPLFEGVVYTARFFKGLLTKKEPLFLYETLLERNFSDTTVVKFIFRRNVILCALTLLSFAAQLQYQPLILAALFLLDFFVRVVSQSKANTSLRSLFREIKENAKESIIETDKALNILKERYVDNKNEKKDE